MPPGRYILAPLTGNKEGSMGRTVLRVSLHNHSLYPGGKRTRLRSIPSVASKWDGLMLLVKGTI